VALFTILSDAHPRDAGTPSTTWGLSSKRAKERDVKHYEGALTGSGALIGLRSVRILETIACISARAMESFAAGVQHLPQVTLAFQSGRGSDVSPKDLAVVILVSSAAKDCVKRDEPKVFSVGQADS